MKLLMKLFLSLLLAATFAQLAGAQAPACDPVTERLGIAIDSHVNNQKCVGCKQAFHYLYREMVMFLALSMI